MRYKIFSFRKKEKLKQNQTKPQTNKQKPQKQNQTKPKNKPAY